MAQMSFFLEMYQTVLSQVPILGGAKQEVVAIICVSRGKHEKDAPTDHHFTELDENQLSALSRTASAVMGMLSVVSDKNASHTDEVMKVTVELEIALRKQEELAEGYAKALKAHSVFQSQLVHGIQNISRVTNVSELYALSGALTSALLNADQVR